MHFKTVTYDKDTLFDMLCELYNMAEAHDAWMVSASSLADKYPSIHHFMPRLEDMGVVYTKACRRYWFDMERQPDEAMAQELAYRHAQFHQKKREGVDAEDNELVKPKKRRKPRGVNAQILEAITELKSRVDSLTGANMALPKEVETDLNNLDSEIARLTQQGECHPK